MSRQRRRGAGVGAQGEQPALTGTVPGGSLASLPHSASIFPCVPTDSNLRLFVSRDGTTTLSGIQLANR